MTELDYLKTDLEKISYFHDLLRDRATGKIGYSDSVKEKEFLKLRELILTKIEYREKMPEFLLKTRRLDDFWLFIKNKILGYEARRNYLRNEFSDLLNFIEFGSVSKPKKEAIEYENGVKDMEESSQKNKKIFISHSSLDKEYAEELVDLLNRFGISSEEILCTSVPGTRLRIGTPDFLEGIKDYLLETPVFICLFSKNYLNSPICLCEMGAAWITSKEQRLMLTPETDFRLASTVVLGRSHGMKINAESDILEVIEGLQDYFIIPKKSLAETNRIVEKYLEAVETILKKKS